MSSHKANHAKSKKSSKVTRNSLKTAVRDVMLPRWKRLSLGLLLVVISRLASMITPGATKFLIDDVFLPKKMDGLTLIVGAVVVAITIQAASNFALVKILGIEAQYLISQLRLKVQEHILHLPLKFFNNEKSGSIVSRIMHDVEGVRNLVGTGLVQLVGGSLTAVVALLILIQINPLMTLYAVLLLIVFAFVMMKAFQTIRPVFRKRGELNAKVTGRLTESIGGIKIIKGFAAEEKEKQVFSNGVDELYQNVRKTMTASAFVSMVTLFLTGIISAIVMYVSAHSVVNNQMTTGEFVSYLLYLGMLAFPIIQMSNIGTQITEAFAGLDRMNEVLAEPLETESEERTVILDEFKGEIQFEDVVFRYEEGEPVLKGLSFEIKPGEVVALVGSSGSGKSTIASLVSSLLKPSSGRILVDGVDMNSLNLFSYRKKLALVLQDDFLFDGTIKENIQFANLNASDDEVERAILMSNVKEFVDRFPEKLETIIGERGVKLSGGQKQRLSLARAILADPKVLVLDEATSALDNQSERLIQDSLEKLLQNRTTLVIAHRLSTIQKADKILVIEEGELVEIGKHDELMESQGRYWELHQYQARI